MRRGARGLPHCLQAMGYTKCIRIEPYDIAWRVLEYVNMRLTS